MIQKTTLTLLRIPFSLFLMPVYFFALSQVPEINTGKAVMVFVILHLLIYPASNGYNSYMDQDENSIGLLEKPPKATRELYAVSLLLDLLGWGWSALIHPVFFICLGANILASRAYSYRRIRLKQYPLLGFLTVILFQGAITYLMVYKATNTNLQAPIPWQGMLISSLLFGGFYPLTQIYQHEQDVKDNVRTISYVLGHKGTFVFSALMYCIADVCLYRYFEQQDQPGHFYILQLFLFPVVSYFVRWGSQVWRNPAAASFHNSLKMNIVAAACTNACFITFLIINHLE